MANIAAFYYDNSVTSDKFATVNYVIVPKYSEIRMHMKQFMITIITKRNEIIC